MNRLLSLALAAAFLVTGCAAPVTLQPTPDLRPTPTMTASPALPLPTATAQAIAAPTEPPPTPTWQPLTTESDGEAVRLRMLYSHLGWQSLYAELQSTEYPPEGSNLLNRIRHYQVWIQQPGQALVLSGRLDEPPSAIFVSDGQRYRLVYPEAARDEQGALLPAVHVPFLPPLSLSDTIYPTPLAP